MIYVLQVMTGKEKDVQWELRKRGYKSYVPNQTIPFRKSGQNTTRNVIYFPSYVFLAVKELTDEIYYAMKTIPYVLHFVPREKPDHLSDIEAVHIRLLSKEQNIIATKTETGWELNVKELEPYVEKVLHRDFKIRFSLPFRHGDAKATLSCEIRKALNQ